MQIVLGRARHTIPAATAFVAVGIAVTVPACRRISTRTLEDSEGRSFRAECDRQQKCKIEQRDGPKDPRGRSDLALRSEGWLVAICNVGSSAVPEDPSDCRPLACTKNTDCPPHHGAKDGDCLNGWCTDPANPVTVADSIMLCLAGTGLGRESPEQNHLYAMALNCGQPCRVPKTCKQP